MWRHFGLEGFVEPDTIQYCFPNQVVPRFHTDISKPGAGFSSRSRFTLAHELAHVVLESVLVERAERVDAQTAERVCDRVAGIILFPKPLIADLLVQEESAEISLKAAADACRRARISLSVLISRLADTSEQGLIPLRSGLLLVTVGRSRKREVNLAPRILMGCLPRRWFLPFNKRLTTLGLEFLGKQFYKAPLYREGRYAGEIPLWDRNERRLRNIPARIEFICYKSSGPLANSIESEIARVMLVAVNFDRAS